MTSLKKQVKYLEWRVIQLEKTLLETLEQLSKTQETLIKTNELVLIHDSLHTRNMQVDPLVCTRELSRPATIRTCNRGCFASAK